ncbi:MAG: hypothetical protein U0183_31810 [Polyangiaceae bacterium]
MPLDGVQVELDSPATVGPMLTASSPVGPTVFVDDRAPRPRLTPSWLNRLEGLPPHFVQAAAQTLADQHMAEVLGLQLKDAERVGSLFGLSMSAAAAVVQRARGEWLTAFVRGYVRGRPENAARLRLAASIRNKASPTQSTSGPNPELLAALCEAGDTRSFALLERTLVASAAHPDLPERAERYRRAGLGCVRSHATNKDRQPAADVAVGLVEGLLAVGQHGELDKALAEVDVYTVPVEVVLAFLLTAKRARGALVSYDRLVEKLVEAMPALGRSDVKDVVTLLA